MASERRTFDVDAYLQAHHPRGMHKFREEHGPEAPVDQSACLGSSVASPGETRPKEQVAKNLRLPLQYYILAEDAAYAAYDGYPEDLRQSAASEAAAHASETCGDESPLQELYIRPCFDSAASAVGATAVQSEVVMAAERLLEQADAQRPQAVAA